MLPPRNRGRTGGIGRAACARRKAPGSRAGEPSARLLRETGRCEGSHVSKGMALVTGGANVEGTLNVLLAARDSDVRRVVFSSSSSVYGANPALPKREDHQPLPLSPYGVSKLAAEHYCRAFSEVYA